MVKFAENWFDCDHWEQIQAFLLWISKPVIHAVYFVFVLVKSPNVASFKKKTAEKFNLEPLLRLIPTIWANQNVSTAHPDQCLHSNHPQTLSSPEQTPSGGSLTGPITVLLYSEPQALYFTFLSQPLRAILRGKMCTDWWPEDNMYLLKFSKRQKTKQKKKRFFSLFKLN